MDKKVYQTFVEHKFVCGESGIEVDDESTEIW